MFKICPFKERICKIKIDLKVVLLDCCFKDLCLLFLLESDWSLILVLVREKMGKLIKIFFVGGRKVWGKRGNGGEIDQF